MATPELAIAKATLSATLFRADPSSLSRQDVDAFFPLVSSALAECSRPNVQKCKAWIVQNIAPSSARSAALVKFLAALSKSLQDEGGKPSLKRKRLHLLYVVNDVIYHVVNRDGNSKFATLWDDFLPGLVANAAAFDKCPKHTKKLENLVNLWEERQCFAAGVISKARDAITNGVPLHISTAPQPTTTSLKLAKDAPYVLPSLHGDPAMPWFDLPAATWLPHLTPNSTKPMLPDLIKPIQLASGPADQALATAVKTLLSDVERIFKGRVLDEDPHADLNELGERVVMDEVTGDIVGGESYYGWSRQFCEKMKKRRRNTKGDGRGRSRSRSSSYSHGRSRSSSPPVFKRRRLSNDSGSRSASRSRSAAQHRDRSYSRSRDPSRSRNRSRSRSAGRNRVQSGHKRPYSRSPSRSRSRSPTPPYRRDHSNHPPPPPQQHLYPTPPFPPVPPGEFPIPPPPPTGYQGPWPPLMGAPPSAWFNPNMAQQMMGGWPVPPPPPPPQHMAPQNNHFEGGRGRGGFRGRGRGGYDRGRGGW